MYRDIAFALRQLRTNFRFSLIVVLTLAIVQAERLAARQPVTAQQKLVLPVGQPG